MSSPFVELAFKTIEAYAQDKKIILPPENLPLEMQKKAGAFVSIKKHHALRGCIGTFAPTKKNAAEEIIAMAVEAANFDPRFSPIQKSEIPELEISVDILNTPEPVDSIKDLDPKKYGLIVQSGRKRGLLLPDLEGVDTPEYQIEICRQKAGIAPDDKIQLYRFTVERHL